MPASVNVGPTKLKPYRPTGHVTDVSSGGGYGPSRPAPEPISDAASGGGYGPSATHTLGAGAPTPNQAAANAAAKTSSSMAQYLAYLKSNMGRQPSLLDQLTKPIIQSYEAQAKAGDAQIAGMTQVYANQLKSIGDQSMAAYQTAETQQNALDTAVGSALQTGDVGKSASVLTQALASAGQNTAPGTGASADVNSTGAAMYASSSAGLSALFQDAAAQDAYNKTLPGLAALSGMQAIGAYNSGLTQAEAQAVSDAQKLIPGIMNAQTNAQNANTRQALANGTLASEQAKANQPKIYGSGTTGYFALLPDGKNVQLTAPGQKAPKTFSSGGNEYTFDPATGQTTQLTNNPKAPKAPPTKGFPDGTERQYNPSTGKWVVISGGKGGGKTASPSSVNSYVKSITEFGSVHTKDASGNYTNTRGVTGHTTSYQNAYKVLRGQYHLTDQQARDALDSTYKRGQDGRAWLSNDEQAVLRQAAASRSPGIGLKGEQRADILRINKDPVSHHRFLSPVQYQILKAAGKLPPGAFQNTPVGSRYYIAEQ